MARKSASYAEILKMAQDYGVDKNALFLQAVEVYRVQKCAVDKLAKEIKGCDTTTNKEYIKGRENLMLHPAYKDLPKHADSINKTLLTMLAIIDKLGHDAPAGDKLGEFLSNG